MKGAGVAEYLAPGAVHIGDVRDLAGRLEPNSVQCIVTSPPYFGLRDYGTATWEGGADGCDHTERMARGDTERETPGGRGGSFRGGTMQYRGTCAKCGAARVDRQLGVEATPEEFVANLVAVFTALRPALKDDGTIWLNLGDSYANDTKWGGATGGKHAVGVHGATGIGRQKVSTGVPPKSLLMIPHRVALALQADGWIVRSDIVWSKPAPMPESVEDRPTRSHEYIFLISKSPRYFYDASAIAEQAVSSHPSGNGYGRPEQLSRGGRGSAEPWQPAPTRNRRSVWTVGSAMFPDAHYATFPPDLIRPCILAGTSARGECAACGKAWVRVVEKVGERETHGPNHVADIAQAANRTGGARRGATSVFRSGMVPVSETTGWRPQCSCDAPTRPQLVLDPFSGSGTTGEVAHQEGRRFVGIDLDERAVGWHRDRLAKLPVGRLFA